MLIVGLTGSIGMGKTTAAKRFAAHGIPVFDADAEVHRLYDGAAAPLVEAAFPGTVADGKVDRRALGAAVVGDPEAFARLEAIVHPLVRDAERRFLMQCVADGHDMAVLEIPLLFETGSDEMVDVTVVVSASAEEQRRRAITRPGMTEEKLQSLLAQQLPDAEKRARADFVVETDGPIEETGVTLDRLIESLRGRSGAAIERWRDAR